MAVLPNVSDLHSLSIHCCFVLASGPAMRRVCGEYSLLVSCTKTKRQIDQSISGFVYIFS